MNLFDLFLYALLGIHLSLSCVQLARLSTSLKWLSHRQPFKSVDAPMNTVYILIPVYKEAAVMKACIEYFYKLSQFPNVHIYYVTTEKEGAGSNTVAIIKHMQANYNFHHLHYPETEGIKAHQLNWAIEQILASRQDIVYATTYFGIYDVDSRPEIEVIKTILFGQAPIYQQPSIYLENYARISPLQKAGALLQTKWELCSNMPVLRTYERRVLQHRRIPFFPTCTGHGLFIRADILKKAGLFETRTLSEDLEFGYRVAFRNIPITLLQVVDYTQYAPTLPATIPQTSRWFSAEIHLYRYYRSEKRKLSSKELQRQFFGLLILKRYFTTLKWAFGAPLIYFALLMLVFRHPENVIFILLSLLVYVYLPFSLIHNCVLFERYLGNKKDILTLFLLGITRPFLNSFGPLHYFLTAPINRIRGRSAIFVRTPKN